MNPSKPVYCLADGVLFNTFAGHTLVYHSATQKMYQFHGIGSRIWELIQARLSSSAIVTHLVQEYEVSEQECETDFNEMISQLVQQGLIV